MKKIVFLGNYDKTDMILQISKIITLMNKKVLFIDTTVLKKSRYIVPTMINSRKYITTFEDVDVAIGFENFEEIRRYQEKKFKEVVEYDFVLIDIDRKIAYQEFNINSEDIHYFVTSFDLFTLKRGVNLLSGIDKRTSLTKIYFTKNMYKEEDECLNYLTEKLNICWKENIIFFPFETSDLDAIYTNQRTKLITMKGLSNNYIESILYLAEEISGESNGKVKKAYKLFEK